MLKKHFIRDGSRKIIGSVTTGYSDTSSLVRDEHNKINGRTNDKLQTPAMHTAIWSRPILPIRVS